MMLLAEAAEKSSGNGKLAILLIGGIVIFILLHAGTKGKK